MQDSSVDALLQSLTPVQQAHAHVMYWALKDHQIITIHRNEMYFRTHMLPHLQDTWKYIQEFLNNDALYQDEKVKREANKLKRKKRKQEKEQAIHIEFRNTS